VNVNRSKRPFYLGLIWTITPLRHLDNEGALDSVMHIASKIILGIGVLMFIISGIGMVSGIGGAIDAIESRTYLEGESSGTFTVNENESWDIQVYIIHPVDCESVELTIVDSRGGDAIEPNYGCSYEYYEGDEMYEYAEGERQLFASISHETSGMEYTLNSNVNVDISGTYCDDACIESLVGGGLGALGGFLGICCSVLILILGIVLAFTLDDKPNVALTSGQIPGGQVMYQTPVTGQAPMTQTISQPHIGQVIQPTAVPITPITPPLVQQPPVEQVTQPIAQQSSVEQDTQPEQTAWWGDEPKQ
jgi:hypothetical protein